MEKDTLATIPINDFGSANGMLYIYADGTYRWVGRNNDPHTYARWRISGRDLFICHSYNAHGMEKWINARVHESPSAAADNALVDNIIDAVEAELEVRKMLSLEDETRLS